MTTDDGSRLYSYYICTNCKALVLADDANAPTDTGYCLCRLCCARMSEEPVPHITQRFVLEVEEGMNGNINVVDMHDTYKENQPLPPSWDENPESPQERER